MFEELKSNLNNNRKGVMKNVTAWFIFGAIILVFVFLGMTPRSQGVGQGGGAAVVNDTTISQATYSEAVERMRRDPRFEQMQSMGGDMARQYMNQQALSQLVEMELLRQATVREHIQASDAEVAQVIYDIPAFQEKGVFKADLYRNLLAANRKTPSDFEADIRTEKSVQSLGRLFTVALQPMPVELEKQKQLAAMKANLEFVSFSTEALIEPESIKSVEAKAFLADAANQTKAKDYFTSHKAEFSNPEEVKVRHILIRAAAGDATAEKAALAKIEDLAKRASKEDFGKLASQYSEDPGSKAKGGVIDFFSRGKMVPEFEEYAFSAKPNEVSKPIKTQYGYHLIQVMDKKAAKESTFEEVNEKIAQKMIAQDRSRTEITALEEELKKGDSAGVLKFAATHNLKWAETGAFSIQSDSVPKIGPNDEVVRSAFMMTAEKPLYPSLVKQGPTAFMLRYKAVPASVAKDENLAMVQEMASGRRAQETMSQWVESLRKSAKISTNTALVSGRGGADSSSDF